MTMKDWVKRFFGSFFLNKYARESAGGGIGSTLLGFVLAFMLMLVSLFGGYSLSFEGYYNSSQGFKNTIYKVFEGLEGVTCKGGRISADKLVNTFEGDEGYTEFGYKVIFDTRPQETTFDSIVPFYFPTSDKNDKSKRKTPEEYEQLSETEKKDYSFGFDRTGVAVDTAAGATEYENYLKAAEDEKTQKAFSDLQTKYPEKGMEYCDKLYVLYITTKFPRLSGADAYGEAPTLRTYYYAKLDEKAGYYVAVFDNMLFACFKTDGGITVDFVGTYSGVSAKLGNTKADADKLVLQSFKSSAGMNFNVYFISSMTNLIFMVLEYLLAGIILFAVFRICKVSDAHLGGCLKAVGSFLLITGVITGVFALGLSFALPRNTVNLASVIIFGGVLFVRTVVFAVLGVIRDRNSSDGETSETPESEIYPDTIPV